MSNIDDSVHALKEILSKIEDGSHSDLDKLLSEYFDKAMKGYFIAGTISTAANAAVSGAMHIPLIFLLMGPVWNYVDSVGGLGMGVYDIKKANASLLNRNSKLSLYSIQLIWSLVIMPGLTGWAAYTTIESLAKTGTWKSLIATSGVSLGASTALATSSFVFAGAMFLGASLSAYAWYRAQKKTNPVNLEIDRRERIQELNTNINKLEMDIEKQQEKISSFRTESINETSRKKDKIDQKIKKIEFHVKKNKEKIESFKKKKNIFENQKEALSKYNNFKLNLSTDQPTNEEKKLVNFLIEKQKIKAEKKKEETIAWVAGGVGAVCVGLGILFPPAAIGLGIAAAGFFAVTSTIKFRQLSDKRRDAKIHRAVYKKIIKENFTEDLKKLSINSQENKFLLNKVEDYLFNLTTIKRESLTTTDIKFFIDLKCREIYEKEIKPSQSKSSCFKFFNKRKQNDLKNSHCSSFNASNAQAICSLTNSGD